MARNPKRRYSRRKSRQGKYLPGNVDRDIPLGTLASNTAILTALPSVTEKPLLSSIKTTWGLAGVTPADNVGPVIVGYSHSDYTLSEVEAWIERGAGSWSQGDKIAQEISNRLIRKVGQFAIPAAVGESTTLNDGKPIKTKLRWMLITGQTINIWTYNAGSVAFSTTDPNVQVQGKANLFVM